MFQRRTTRGGSENRRLRSSIPNICKKLGRRSGRVYYSRLDEYLTKEEKYCFLDEIEHQYNVEWEERLPDKTQRWLEPEGSSAFERFIPIGSREAKAASTVNVETIFKTYSLGVSTNRDAVVYDFDKEVLLRRVEQFIEDYNAEVLRYIKRKPKKAIEDFVSYKNVDWSETLLTKLKRKHLAEFDPSRLRQVLYRTFTKKWLYYDPFLIDRPGLFSHIFPIDSQGENLAIGVCTHSQAAFSALMVNRIPSLDLNGRPTQFFPFFVYGDDGRTKQENITDWSLEHFQQQYGSASITKEQIFYYVYAVLNHPTYQKEFSAVLRRQLPRIPLSANFDRFCEAGRALSELHAFFEKQPSYPLERQETGALDWQVERIRLSPDKSSIIYNDFLTLTGIPEQTYEYRIGNRSALNWVIDQYQITRDEAGHITENPNKNEEEDYIITLLERVVHVSVASVEIIRSLPRLDL